MPLAIVFGSWLTLLALAMVAVSRELGLLRADSAGILTRVRQGPPIGTFVRGLAVGARTHLFVEPDCAPCEVLLEQFDPVPPDVVLVFRGDSHRAKAAILRHNPSASLVGPEAIALFDRLGIVATPFALRTVHGVVVGKSLPGAPADLNFTGALA